MPDAAPRPRLVSVPLPRELLARIESMGAEELRSRASVLWELPAGGTALFGFGNALTLHGGRTSPLADAATRLRSVMAQSLALPLAPQARPRFFGGARFSPSGTVTDPAWEAFGGWRLTVPSVLVAFSGDTIEGSLTLLVSTDCQDLDRLAAEALAAPFAAPPVAVPSRASGVCPPPASDWRSKVATALREIEDRRYGKIVLARSALAAAPAPFETGEVLTRLAERYPQCFIFKYRESGADWLGASPELLCSVQDGAVRAASLAGSRPRGATESDDRRLEEDLLASPKERAEHAFVSLAIGEALAPLCDGLSAPEVPSVMKMANIQHLYTPLAGRLRPGFDLLDVVGRLHPTPAVGGWPRAEALGAIERLEGMDRGWYAGPIGWLDMRGDGEFAVALRSALVTGSRARLYAGAGIVAGSDPEEEYAETEAKLRPLREALEAGTGG